jgi:hypothetical protein
VSSARPSIDRENSYVAPNQAPSSTAARNLSNPQANRILARAPEPLSPCPIYLSSGTSAAKPAPPALPFPVRADGREAFLSNETEVFDHGRSLPPKPVKLRAEPPLTRMSNELTSLRASVNKRARAQNTLLFNVKALSEQVQSL